MLSLSQQCFLTSCSTLYFLRTVTSLLNLWQLLCVKVCWWHC
jgi:hypothetical protein